MNTQFFINPHVIFHQDWNALAKRSQMDLMYMSDYVFQGRKCLKSRTGDIKKTKRSSILQKFQGVIICTPVTKQKQNHATTETTTRTTKPLI